MQFLNTGLEIYALVCAFIFGAVAGSAMNCLAMRIVRHESWAGKSRSKCLFCGHTLSPLDLVPVFSYIFLRGKCRYCKKKISPRYLITEVCMGLIFVLLALRAITNINAAFDYAQNVSWLDQYSSVSQTSGGLPAMTGFNIYVIQTLAELFFGIILACCLLSLSLADIESFEIPDRFLAIPAAARIIDILLFGSRHAYFGYSPDHGIVYHIFAKDINTGLAWREILLNTVKPILTGLILGSTFLVLSLFMDKILKKNSLGGGDIKLFAMTGLWLRPIVLLPMILLSCIIGLVPSLIAMKRAQNEEDGAETEQNESAAENAAETPDGCENSADAEDEEEIPAGAFPFGPAISAALLICVLYGEAIISLYLRLTGIG